MADGYGKVLQRQIREWEACSTAIHTTFGASSRGATKEQ